MEIFLYRYVTIGLKLEAGKNLKKIVLRLIQTTEKNFTQKIDNWYEKYEQFLEEKSIFLTTGELHCTHPRIRAAYRSLSKFIFKFQYFYLSYIIFT